MASTLLASTAIMLCSLVAMLMTQSPSEQSLVTQNMKSFLIFVVLPHSLPNECAVHKVLQSREHSDQCKTIIAPHSRVCGCYDKPGELFLVDRVESVLLLLPFALVDLWLGSYVLVLCGTCCYAAVTGCVLSWDGGRRGGGGDS